jgi:alcohol dehydrogenase class IV
LTGEYGIPHGRANALVAGAALRALAGAAPQRCAELAALWFRAGEPPGADDLPGAGADGAASAGLAAAARCAGTAGAAELATVFDELRRRLGVGSLAGYGVPRDRLPELARLACGYQPVLRNSPLDLTEAGLARLYDQAWRDGAGDPAAGEADP